MRGQYILRGHTPVEEPDLLKWARWFEKAPRTVAFDQFEHVNVSTVFLGLDHSYMGDAPIVFETMVFGGKLNGEQERYSTWDEAEVGHKTMLDRVIKVERVKTRNGH